MSYNGISESSQQEIAAKVANKFIVVTTSPDLKTIAKELLMETGYPVDHKDFGDLLMKTVSLMLERGKKDVHPALKG